MGKKEKMGRRRLVLVPCPLQGHISPMLQLGSILHSKGFSITIVHTQLNSLQNPSNYNSNFKFVSIPDGIPDSVLTSRDLVGLINGINTNCVVPFKDYLIQEMGTMDPRKKFACIIYDEFMSFAESVACQLKLPSIILRTNSSATYLARTVLLQLIADGSVPLPGSLLQDPVPGQYPLRFKDLPTSNFGTLKDFVQIVDQGRRVRTSSAVIWNTMDCLEMQPLEQMKQHCHVPIFAIGPMHRRATTLISSSLLKEDRSCISWLDKQAINSVIYVSLGSLACMDETEFTEMAWGLANSKQPFLWVLRPGSVLGLEFLPDGFIKCVGERGCIVKWAPQKEVLAHRAVGGFWTHCGWNSTLESICEGVPMICRPSFGDQKVTARYVTHVWKVGLQLEGELRRGEVARVIRLLMVGEEIRQRAMELKESSEVCAREGGSSNNSLQLLIKLIKSF